MKKFFSGKQIVKIVCLLLAVGILCISDSKIAYASSYDSNLTGETDNRTYINEAGSAETADELNELNIANTVTVTYNDGNGQVNGTLRILITLTLIALAPSLIIMLTSFTRIIIVLHFTRAALNTQTAPPNQILIGLALFLTFFIMEPVITEINTNAVVPFEAGQISQEEAFEEALAPIREFMYGQTDIKDVRMFLDRSDAAPDGRRAV